MSLTSTVLAAVPSLFQSSRPFVGSKAAKKSVPFTSARLLGRELLLPGLMSFTGTVPAVVPSLFQSSAPFVGTERTKIGVPFTAVSGVGEEGGKRAARATVPA